MSSIHNRLRARGMSAADGGNKRGWLEGNCQEDNVVVGQAQQVDSQFLPRDAGMRRDHGTDNRELRRRKVLWLRADALQS